MSGNNRTLEVDKFLTRSLYLKNPDNTTPSPNLSVLTDGAGGTYLRSVFNTENPAGYNAVYLVDSNVSTVANLAYNTLKLKEGPGVAILKDRDENIVIKSISLIPSSFSFLSTPVGTIYSERVMGTLNLIPEYGVNFSIANNALHMSGNPGFGAIYLSTQTENETSSIIASEHLSSFSLVSDYGISMKIRDTNVLHIANTNIGFGAIYLSTQTEYETSSIVASRSLASLNLIPDYGILMKISDPNSLHIGSYPGFGAIYVSTQTENETSSIIASDHLSSFSLVSDYGISLKIKDTNVLHIGNTNIGFGAIYLSTQTENATSSIIASRSLASLNLVSDYGISMKISDTNSLHIGSNPGFGAIYLSTQTKNETSSIIASDHLSSLSLVSDYGISMKISDKNVLHIGSYPGFGAIYLSSQNAYGADTIVASEHLSSLKIVSDFGVKMKISDDVLHIGTTSQSYSLNQITANKSTTFSFINEFNNLNLVSKGNIVLNQKDISTLEILSNVYSRVHVDDKVLESAVSGSTLRILSGYGLTTNISTSAIVISSTKPSFDRISTSKGTISTNFTNTTLNITTGNGIDYDIVGQTLNLKLVSTFAFAIQTETVSTMVEANSVLNLRAGSGIEYSNTADGALQIATNDFNQIKIGGQILNSNKSDAAYKKKLRLLGLGPLLVQGDPTTNTVSFLLTGELKQPSTMTGYAQIYIYSSITNLNSDISDYPSPFILNSAPDFSASLGIQGVAPISVTPRYDFLQSSLFYISLDEDYLFRSTIRKVDATRFSIYNSTVLSSDKKGIKLTISNMTSNEANIKNLTVSSITSFGGNTIIAFDYINNRIGINKNGRPPLATLDVSGTIVAKMYASYSDPALKSFKGIYTVSPEQIDSLVPRYFNWLEDDKPDVGFSAHDVENILPEAVRIGPTGLKMVDYSRLSIITIAALRDSNNRIAALESTITAILNK